MAIQQGTRAPGFRLFNTSRKEVSLEDLRGSTIVLHFFPAAFSGICTEQLCTSRDDFDFYKGINATVFGISVDMPYSLKEFKEKHGINFELLSDFNKRTIHEYDMYFCNFAYDMKGVAKRGVVVIDPGGTVIYSEETAHPGAQVDFEKLKKVLVTA